MHKIALGAIPDDRRIAMHAYVLAALEEEMQALALGNNTYFGPSAEAGLVRAPTMDRPHATPEPSPDPRPDARPAPKLRPPDRQVSSVGWLQVSALLRVFRVVLHLACRPRPHTDTCQWVGLLGPSSPSAGCR